MGLKRLGNIYESRGQAGMIYDSEGLSPSLTPAKRGGKAAMPIVVSGQTSGTNMPAKSTKNTMENATRGTSEQLGLVKSPSTTLSVQDFLAKVSRLLGNGKDSVIRGVRYFMKYAGSLGFTEPLIYSLRTSRDSSITIRERPSRSSSNRWMSWGMTANGRCLTARISVFPKTGKGCSLSDILEDKVDPKYFLSERGINKIFKRVRKNQKEGRGFQPLTVGAGKDGQLKPMFEQTSRIHGKEGISPTIPTPSGRHHIPMVCESDD